MAAVRRDRRISVSFLNEDGREDSFVALPVNISELLQHEIDHLDGILMTDRVISPKDSLVMRGEWLARRDHYARMVDYTIY